MSKPLLLVYDDEESMMRRYLERLENIPELEREFEMDSISDEEFLRAVESLRERVRHSRNRRTNEDDWNSRFDEASVSIIDYDLIDAASISENGEEIAYYLRFFSKCNFIIGLNRFGQSTFDLTLMGHVDSYADLNIGARDLANRGLWTGESDGFRPWYWPSVIEYCKSFRKRIDDVTENFSRPMLEVLGFPEHVFLSLPPNSLECLATERDVLIDATIQDFFERSSLVLKEKDRRSYFSDEAKGRATAARISKWLERTVFPGQDILVDAPHLVWRFPSLLTGDLSRLRTWNKTASFGPLKDLGIRLDKIRKFSFKNRHWLSRPAWFWQDVIECDSILEVREPWKKANYDYVFAEDSSQFSRRGSCREFTSDVDSPFRRRFVRQFSDYDYRPRIRLYKEP